MRSKMYPRNLFVFSAYWRTWSRVLRFSQHGECNQTQVEVDLTATNPTTALHWPRVQAINIREHHTARNARDLYTADLPLQVVELMRTWMPEEVVQRLLHEDFLPQIDWDKYQKHNNGGCRLHMCLKDDMDDWEKNMPGTRNADGQLNGVSDVR
jgi:hypothetical protein